MKAAAFLARACGPLRKLRAAEAAAAPQPRASVQPRPLRPGKTPVPPDVEAALRARFCGFVKGRVPYLLSTFHPHYHAFKYGTEAGGAAKQLERDLETAVSRFKYSGFKVLETAPGSHSDEAFITFRYNSVAKTRAVRPTGDSFVAETNFDGTAKVSTTIERSRFLRDPASGGQWLFADYTLIDYPTWMEEAKQAELRARGEAGAGAGAGGSA
eukprot:XP_001695055.1 predicted protein [Chlamydomonas reinhardtii]